MGRLTGNERANHLPDVGWKQRTSPRWFYIEAKNNFYFHGVKLKWHPKLHCSGVNTNDVDEVFPHELIPNLQPFAVTPLFKNLCRTRLLSYE